MLTLFPDTIVSTDQPSRWRRFRSDAAGTAQRIARFDVILHVPDTIPAMHYTAIEEVARTCPVHHTLTQAPEIAVQLQELVAAGTPA